jgi:hypothetical protein
MKLLFLKKGDRFIYTADDGFMNAILASWKHAFAGIKKEGFMRSADNLEKIENQIMSLPPIRADSFDLAHCLTMSSNIVLIAFFSVAERGLLSP